MSTIYVVGYSIGEYSDHSEEMIAGVLSREVAQTIVDAFSALRDFYAENQHLYQNAKEFAAAAFVDRHGELPVHPSYGSTKTSAANYAALFQAYKAAVKPFEDFMAAYEKEWWATKESELPESVQKYAHKYPRDKGEMRGSYKPDFQIWEIPIWNAMA